MFVPKHVSLDALCIVEKSTTSSSEDRSTKRGDKDFPLTNGRALALSYLGV
jgi:hypothetical protein